MRLPTNRLLMATGALCAVMLAAAPASAFRGGEGGRGDGGRSASLGARSSGSAPSGGARLSGAHPSGSGPSGGGPSRPSARPSGGYLGSADRGRANGPGIQRQDRAGRNVPQDRIGRSFPSHHPAGLRFAGGDRRVTLESHHSHHDWHGHTSHCGGGSWDNFHHSHFVSFFSPVVIVPAPIFITTPFFCGLCGIGFAGPTFFQHHIHFIHGLAFESIDSFLFDVDGRVVFAGF